MGPTYYGVDLIYLLLSRKKRHLLIFMLIKNQERRTSTDSSFPDKKNLKHPYYLSQSLTSLFIFSWKRDPGLSQIGTTKLVIDPTLNLSCLSLSPSNSHLSSSPQADLCLSQLQICSKDVRAWNLRSSPHGNRSCLSQIAATDLAHASPVLMELITEKLFSSSRSSSYSQSLH